MPDRSWSHSFLLGRKARGIGLPHSPSSRFLFASPGARARRRGVAVRNGPPLTPPHIVAPREPKVHLRAPDPQSPSLCHDRSVSVVGRGARRLEGGDKVAGATRYTAHMEL